MAFLSAPLPDWHLELGGVAGQVCDDLAASVPGSSGWYVRASVDGRDLVATCNHSPMSKRETVLGAGSVLVPLWPGWLDESDVGCVVWLPGFSVAWRCGAMMERAAGAITAREWWAAGDVTLG